MILHLFTVQTDQNFTSYLATHSTKSTMREIVLSTDSTSNVERKKFGITATEISAMIVILVLPEASHFPDFCNIAMPETKWPPTNK